jgi:hypothetical protein
VVGEVAVGAGVFDVEGLAGPTFELVDWVLGAVTAGAVVAAGLFDEAVSAPHEATHPSATAIAAPCTPTRSVPLRVKD